ncbi:hypothetical protein K438DRAFT_1778531 [Mycena galopus ATCC 62051]|nr:hypothetical protein K438DRAFT_1778531 [Mycena galopus ATCC 62051]
MDEGGMSGEQPWELAQCRSSAGSEGIVGATRRLGEKMRQVFARQRGALLLGTRKPAIAVGEEARRKSKGFSPEVAMRNVETDSFAITYPRPLRETSRREKGQSSLRSLEYQEHRAQLAQLARVLTVVGRSCRPPTSSSRTQGRVLFSVGSLSEQRLLDTLIVERARQGQQPARCPYTKDGLTANIALCPPEFLLSISPPPDYAEVKSSWKGASLIPMIDAPEASSAGAPETSQEEQGRKRREKSKLQRGGSLDVVEGKRERSAKRHVGSASPYRRAAASSSPLCDFPPRAAPSRSARPAAWVCARFNGEGGSSTFVLGVVGLKESSGEPGDERAAEADTSCSWRRRSQRRMRTRVARARAARRGGGEHARLATRRVEENGCQYTDGGVRVEALVMREVVIAERSSQREGVAKNNPVSSCLNGAPLNTPHKTRIRLGVLSIRQGRARRPKAELLPVTLAKDRCYPPKGSCNLERWADVWMPSRRG